MMTCLFIFLAFFLCSPVKSEKKEPVELVFGQATIQFLEANTISPRVLPEKKEAEVVFVKKIEEVTPEVKEVKPDDKKGCGKVQKKGWSEEASYWVQRAYDKSGCDKSFVLMLEGENGSWDFKSQSQAYTYFIDGNKVSQDEYVSRKNNCKEKECKNIFTSIREDSWGFCQIHRKWHADTVDNPLFFTSQEWQLDRCLEKWRGGTIFYGANNHKAKENILFL